MTAFDVVADGHQQPDDNRKAQGISGKMTDDAHPQTAASAPLIGRAEPAEAQPQSAATPGTPATCFPVNAPTCTLPMHDFYKAAIDHAGIPIIGLDRNGLICCWNQMAARLFGREAPEVVGKPMDMLVPPEYRAIAWRALQRTLQQRSVNCYEMAFVPPGGKNALHLGVTLSCVLSAQGQCAGVMAWVRDITNRKELESNLLRTRHIASLGTLAAGVAHHFNNIVCGMNTMVELALSTEDEFAMKRALRMSAEAASRISYITQSLLAFSTQEAGEPDLVDLTEEILRFADAVEPTLRQRGIELVLDLRGARVAAVPRHRFSQVLHHLLRNAEESFEGIKDGRVRRITLTTLSQDDQVMLQFTDTGCGVAAEHLPQLFDPFFTTKGVQGGGNKNNPGLGLTLAQGVVMDMGGHIWADSVPGQGTTLSILVPVSV